MAKGTSVAMQLMCTAAAKMPRLDGCGGVAPENGQTFGVNPYPALPNAMSGRAHSSGGPSNSCHG